MTNRLVLLNIGEIVAKEHKRGQTGEKESARRKGISLSKSLLKEKQEQCGYLKVTSLKRSARRGEQREIRLIVKTKNTVEDNTKYGNGENVGGLVCGDSNVEDWNKENGNFRNSGRVNDHSSDRILDRLIQCKLAINQNNRTDTTTKLNLKPGLFYYKS